MSGYFSCYCFVNSVARNLFKSTTALMTGTDAVDIAFKSSIISHFLRCSAKRSKLTIICSLSGKLRLVTAISISLDSRARPVTKDPYYLIAGTY